MRSNQPIVENVLADIEPLTLRGVSKTFPGQVALRSVDLTIRYGQVHAVVGQNGSGKSTLIKILAGYHRPDVPTSTSLNGTSFELGDGKEAYKAGLRFVHQDLGLVLDLSILENVMLGREYPTGFARRIQWHKVASQVEPAVRRMGVDADLSTPMRSLSVAERTAVAVARVRADTIDNERLVVVLDEPTAALPPDEVSRLLDLIATLRTDGHAVLLVSHHLDEVLRVADWVTVLRDGQVAASAARSEIDHDSLTGLIIGHELESAPARGSVADLDDRAVVMDVRNVSGGRVTKLDFRLHRGEILGVTGISGSGREHVASLLNGRLPRDGVVTLENQPLPPLDPFRALTRHMATVSGERQQFGLFENLNVRANMTICDVERHQRRGRIRVRDERAEVLKWIRNLGIVTTGPEARMDSLSGGNQQKVLIARALRLNPKVLVMDDPTLGVDIGAREQIHAIIEQCAAEGTAVVLVSTDSDELARLSDRVLVLGRGMIMRTLHKSSSMTASAIDVGQLAAASVVVG